MSRTTNFAELAFLTLKDPRAASAVVLQWRLPKEALWTGVALVTVIVTLLSTLSNMIFPVPDPLQSILGSPFVYLMVAGGGFVATVYATYWAGRLMGGAGEVEDLMVLLLWLQALRAAAQVIVLICLLIAPFVAPFIVLFVAVATLWIFAHFINAGLRLNSVMRAIVVMVVGALALVAGLTFLLSLLGISAVGVPLNV